MHNHTNPHKYGLSFFISAVETIYKEKKEFIKNIAYGVRIGKYAENIDEIFEEEKVYDGLLNL